MPACKDGRKGKRHGRETKRFDDQRNGANGREGTREVYFQKATLRNRQARREKALGEQPQERGKVKCVDRDTSTCAVERTGQVII
jgi:hypothetical protein